MTTITYVSSRTRKRMQREGDVIVDQFPGDRRRIVLLRPNGKKLKFEMPGHTLHQRRDDESKWTKTGTVIEVDDLTIEDECSCGYEFGQLINVDCTVSDSFNGGLYVPMHGDWKVVCNECGETHDPKTEPDEPPWPEPDGDEGVVLQEVQRYAEHVNEVIFDNEIDLDRVSWEWNPHNRSTAGRAWAYKIQLTPQYFERHGWNELLKVVRHELVHVWEHHAGPETCGHAAQFHDWLVPANTRRHCKWF